MYRPGNTSFGAQVRCHRCGQSSQCFVSRCGTIVAAVAYVAVSRVRVFLFVSELFRLWSQFAFVPMLFPRGHDPITHARRARCLAHVGSIFNECCHCHWFIVVTFLKMVSCDGYPVVTCGRTESPRSHGCEFPVQCSFLCAPVFLCVPDSTCQQAGLFNIRSSAADLDARVLQGSTSRVSDTRVARHRCSGMMTHLHAWSWCSSRTPCFGGLSTTFHFHSAIAAQSTAQCERADARGGTGNFKGHIRPAVDIHGSAT